MICYLYRLFDNDDTLLYVGASKAPQTRLSAHRTKSWGAAIVNMTEEAYPTRESAQTAEREAIASEQPLHNFAHHPDPLPRRERNLNYRIPNDLHHALKIRAAEEKVTLKNLIETTLRDGLRAT